MNRIFLARHGETTFLREEPESRVFNNASLSEAGIEQIRVLTLTLKGEAPDIIFTSTLKRSIESAAILNEVWQVPVIETSAFDEFRVLADGSGTESTESGLARSLGFVNQKRTDYGVVCIVAHNSIMSLLMSSILNIPYSSGKSLFPEPGSAYILSYDWQQGEQNRGVVHSSEPIVPR